MCCLKHMSRVLSCYTTCKERLVNAARARLGRWMKPHPKRKDLGAPKAIKDYWAGGHKQEMSVLLRDLNFDRVDRQPKLSNLGWHVEYVAFTNCRSRRIKDQFCKVVEVIITKKETIKLKLDEGWCSETEMKNDLGWSTLEPQL